MKMDMQETFKLLGKQWTLPVLNTLNTGDRTWRFTELMRHTPKLTPKVLATRLKDLQERGYVEKMVDDQHFTVTIHYQITASGRKLIEKIKEWEKR